MPEAVLVAVPVRTSIAREAGVARALSESLLYAESVVQVLGATDAVGAAGVGGLFDAGAALRARRSVPREAKRVLEG